MAQTKVVSKLIFVVACVLKFLPEAVSDDGSSVCRLNSFARLKGSKKDLA
jgi:hypothetical protein